VRDITAHYVTKHILIFGKYSHILYLFLAYFPKMKLGLSNHHLVCIFPTITFEPISGFS